MHGCVGDQLEDDGADCDQRRGQYEGCAALFQRCHGFHMGGDLCIHSQVARMPQGVEVRQRSESNQDENRHSKHALIEKGQHTGEAEKSACADGHRQRSNQGYHRTGGAENAEDDRADAGSRLRSRFDRIVDQTSRVAAL